MTLPDPADDAADRALLLAIATKDRRAFEALYRKHHPRLARFLRRFSAHHDLIDDVINEALLVVWRSAGDFRGASKVSTWTMGIAYRCMLKAMRGRTSDVSLDDTMFDDNGVGDAAAALWVNNADEVELKNWVASGLRTLPEDQRTTLELAYFAGLSCSEIAEVMACAVGTVKARMFHARVRLRSVMPVLGGLRTVGANDE